MISISETCEDALESNKWEFPLAMYVLLSIGLLAGVVVICFHSPKCCSPNTIPNSVYSFETLLYPGQLCNINVYAISSLYGETDTLGRQNGFNRTDVSSGFTSRFPSVLPAAVVNQAGSLQKDIAKTNTPDIITNGSRSLKRVALTFDLCEAQNDLAGFDDKIVGILFDKQAKATFFMGGKWAESHPDNAWLLSAISFFEIENHSYSHRTFTNISDEEAKLQVTKAQASIRKLTGMIPKYFRFPAGEYMGKHLSMMKSLGLRAVQWDVVTDDPEQHVSADDIVNIVKDEAIGGSIIIMHANGRGWHTAEALPAMIDYLRAAGYELVTVDELLNSDKQ